MIKKIATNRRFLPKDAFKRSEKFTVIIGCGRLGSLIANKISDGNGNVLVIDRNADAFRRLSSNYGGLTLVADGTNIESLKEANVDQADQLIAVTDNDNVNIFVGQLAKVEFNIHKVIVRVIDKERNVILNKYNIETICPAELTSEAVNIILGGDLQEDTDE